ncbi:hypothetical protein ML8HA_00144 [Lactococcus lactis]|nr:hypothetical protein [Lactococcus lactis]
MVKYSIELKQRVIQDYLSGKGGSTYLAKLHNVGSSSQVRRWIRNYRERSFLQLTPKSIKIILWS